MNVPVILALGAIIVFAVVMGVVMSRDKDPQRRAAALTRTGAAVMAAFTIIGGIFIGGFAMQDPGGTTGTLLALASAFIAACVWLAFDPAALSAFLNDNGPLIAVSVLALAFPAAILGLKVTALAGWLLVGLGVLPLLITIIGRSGAVGSLIAASLVPLACGIAYLLSVRMARAGSTSGTIHPAAA